MTITKKAALLFIIILALPSLWAQNIPDGLEYQIWSDGVEITGYTGVAATLNIPAQIQGLPVTDIGYAAFQSSSLTSITIPSSVTTIDDFAFSECEFLTTITIPPSVTYIGDLVFAFCGALTDITVDSSNSIYASIDGVLFDKDIRIIIAFPAGKTTSSYSIPSTVNAIGHASFSTASSLTSITIPSSVITIGSYAFAICYNLTSIIIPSSVTYIGSMAFASCDSLTNVTLSRRASVGESAFPETARITYRD
jgi:hypothetical protein